jgi:rubrerythrin
MPFEQARDMILRARAFHRELGEFYARVEDVVQKERVKLLLEYLVEHERRMIEHLEAIQEGLPPDVLNTWMQYPPDAPLPPTMDDLRISPDATASDVICMALDLDERLLKMYKELAVYAPSAEVREAFLSLYQEGCQERSKLVLDMFEPE